MIYVYVYVCVWVCVCVCICVYIYITYSIWINMDRLWRFQGANQGTNRDKHTASKTSKSCLDTDLFGLKYVSSASEGTIETIDCSTFKLIVGLVLQVWPHHKAHLRSQELPPNYANYSAPATVHVTAMFCVAMLTPCQPMPISFWTSSTVAYTEMVLVGNPGVELKLVENKHIDLTQFRRWWTIILLGPSTTQFIGARSSTIDA